MLLKVGEHHDIIWLCYNNNIHHRLLYYRETSARSSVAFCRLHISDHFYLDLLDYVLLLVYSQSFLIPMMYFVALSVKI